MGSADEYAVTMASHKFRFCPLQNTSNDHDSDSLMSVLTATYAVSRQAKLARDVRELQNHLPAPSFYGSIFVRVDETRLDVINVLICGAQNTPYQDGLFEFGFSFPPNFPALPPSVRILTTGGGKIRFNPNLYANGKVCLSLLNTWAGNVSEMWNEDVSTILQVVLSIQALVMNDTPWFNEPGHEDYRGSTFGQQESLKYNLDIRSQTLQHAMVGQLRNPSQCFRETIRAHFLMKNTFIMADYRRFYHQPPPSDFDEKFRTIRQSVTFWVQNFAEEVGTLTPDPAADTPVPAADTPVPAADTPVPATDTPDPAADTPVPAADTPVPAADTPDPAADTPVPAADTPVPAADTPVPAADTPDPAADTPVPAADTPVPAADTPVPAADTPDPAADTPVPAADTPVPAADTPVPAADTPDPAADTPVPAADTPDPAADTPVPAADTPVPAADTPVPAADTPVPAADTPVPAADTPDPAADTPVPAADTPVPAADTPVPAADTPVPAADTPDPAADTPDP